MYSKIADNMLVKFDDRDLVNGEFVIPSNVKTIGSSAFAFSEIKSVVISEGVENIMFSAFYKCKHLTRVNIPKTVTRLEDVIFMDCENLVDVILLPSSISYIGENIFLGCSSLKTVTNGKKILQFSIEVQNNFSECYPFIQYAIKNNKFLPDVNIILNTNDNEIENFYTYSKRWQAIFNKYDKAYGVKDKENEVGHFALHNAKNNLYQICVILGVFQNHTEQEWNKISEFIEQNILTLEPDILHGMCSGFNTTNGYNDEFAKFFIKNYTPPRMEDDVELCFMERLEVKEDDIPNYALTEEEYEMYTKPQVVRYLGRAYNNWDKVKFAYPNRTILNHREHASENNSLTVDDVINAIKITKYDKVDEDNEEMAKVVGAYGYTQQEFEELQNIWNKGKIIKPEQMTLKVEEDSLEGKDVKYELLAKDNPESLILGEKTNCCQVINDYGRSCMEYGATKPNSGFIKFTLDGQIIGQSWVWYNKSNKLICLDNIEIPTIWLNRFKKSENLTKSFQQCLIRLANGFINEMEKNDCQVNNVTVGAGYNDFYGIERFEEVNEVLNGFSLPDDYMGYSDAKGRQYIISGVKFEDLYTEGVTL